MDVNLGLDQDLINAVAAITEASCSAKKMEKEELHPNQKVLDKNGNGKLDADDFKKLRKEDTVEEVLDEGIVDQVKGAVKSIKRGNEAHNKGWGKFGQAVGAARRGDDEAARKAGRDANRYRNIGLGAKGKTAGGFPKSTKEEFTLEDYSLEDLQDFMMSEEFQELDELSKKTLGSYVKKAADDKAFRMHTQHHFAHNQDIVDGERKKYNNRDAGITKAVNRLTGSKLSFKDNQGNKKRMHIEDFNLEDYSMEELEDFMMSEDFEQLDEISGKVLGSYIQKARADASARYAHGKELDADPKVKKISDKITDYYNRKEYTKSGASKHANAIAKAHDARDAAKKKIDPNYPKSVSGNKRLRGVDKAISKLQHGKLTNEQMEEIEALAAKHGLGE